MVRECACAETILRITYEVCILLYIRCDFPVYCTSALFEADHLLLTRQRSSKMSSAEGTGRTKADQDNRSNQCNPNNSRYQGHTPEYSGIGTKTDLDNHANQLNPNNKEYRGPPNPGNKGTGGK